MFMRNQVKALEEVRSEKEAALATAAHCWMQLRWKTA